MQQRSHTPAGGHDHGQYIAARIALANERLLAGGSAEQRIRAAKWVVAWAMAAGAATPRHLTLRVR